MTNQNQQQKVIYNSFRGQRTFFSPSSLFALLMFLSFSLMACGNKKKTVVAQEQAVEAAVKAPMAVEAMARQSFSDWLKEYIPAAYPDAKITDHGGWTQAHLSNGLVVNWAEWNEENVTLKYIEAHALSDGKNIFIEKSKQQDWPESATVSYYDGAGYYIEGYNSGSMSGWGVQGSTLIQFDGDGKDFAQKASKAWSGTRLVTWLKRYISEKFPDAKIDDHGGWLQAHLPNLVVSWAEWNEESITLSGVHSLDQDEPIFVENKSKVWPESTSVKYYDGLGYYITGYDSATMADWDVKHNTVAQLRGDHGPFIEEMVKEWSKSH